MKPADPPMPLPKVEPSDRLGAIVPAPAHTALEGADLTNVIVLANRRNAGDAAAPAVSVKEDERPAPIAHARDRAPWTMLIAGALLLHLALVLTFLRDPAPVSSLDLDSISVEIVLGGQTEAGVAQTPSPEQSAPSPPAESAPQPPKVTEHRTEPEQTKPELRPRIETETQEHPRAEPQREESHIAAAEPEPAPAPAAAEPEPAPPAAEHEPKPKQAEPEKLAPVEKPVASQPPPNREPAEKSRPQSKPTPPRAAASQSGVGIGSSRATQEWASRVSAHLARNKRYPADALARGIGGTAVIFFALDGSGAVASVRLVRSSGNTSLDRESQDLVRRASPFPPPPQGKASITVPVNFNVRAPR
jgi:TonB family protein